VKGSNVKEISEAQVYDIERHGVGAVGGSPVWDLVNGFQDLYEAGVLCAPDLDGVIQAGGESLIPRGDLIVLLGIAALRKLESKPGVVIQ
jgi:hypothetical protein